MKSIVIIFCILFMWLVVGVSFYEIKIAAPQAKASELRQAKLKAKQEAAQAKTGKSAVTAETRVVNVATDNTLASSDVEINEAVRLDIQRAVAAQVSTMD